MKTIILFIIAGAAFLLNGCSKDDDVPQDTYLPPPATTPAPPPPFVPAVPAPVGTSHSFNSLMWRTEYDSFIEGYFTVLTTPTRPDLFNSNIWQPAEVALTFDTANVALILSSSYPSSSGYFYYINYPAGYLRVLSNYPAPSLVNRSASLRVRY